MLDGGGLGADGLPFPEPIEPVPPLDPGAISGRVWVDTDGDRSYDGAELGQGGVTVYSDLNFNGRLDLYEPSAVAEFDDPVTDFDEGGLYTLENLQPGWHNVRQVTPSGFEQTFPSLPDGFLPPPWGDPSVHVTFVDAGASVDGIDFGNQEIVPGAVTGLKWEDVNGNGVRDEGELGVPGVIIFSDMNFNGVPDPSEPQTVTSEDDPNTDFDESGQYRLEGLQPGVNWIKEVVPDGWRQTFPNFFFIDPLGQEPGDLIFPPEILPAFGSHDVVIESGQTIDGLDFGNQRIPLGSISGVKWDDANGNAERDPGEAGLAGVTIYADLNNNGQLDASEPSTVTSADIPETDFDEGGLYTLEGLRAGDYVIREVVPDGFRQTFPVIGDGIPRPFNPLDGIPSDELGRVEPGRLDLNLAAGEILIQEVTLTIDAAIFQPIEIDVVAQSPDGEFVQVINLGGPQTNGGSGDVSVFTLMFFGDGLEFAGELAFVDTNPAIFAPPVATIPLTINAGAFGDGSHRVWLDPGEHVDGIDFGNQALELGSISGVKWDDANGNGVRDGGEVGLPGVTIYLDTNFNQELDPGEPTAITTADIPETDFDEGGLYSFGVEAGLYAVREVVPDGYRQTFPSADFPTPFPSPLLRPSLPGEEFAHFVSVQANQQVENVDFGNQAVEPGLGGVAGRKWLDADGNREQGPDEPGLPGVTIYADLNRNGVFDANEPSTVTMEDIPETDFDEAGLYSLELEAGEHWIAEVVPDGFAQTFPLNPVIAIFPPPPGAGVHFVTVVSGQTVDGLDFGNRPVENGSVSGTVWDDRNGNGEQDPDEPGLGNVTVYADYNFNGQLDVGEPSTVSIVDLLTVFPNDTGKYDLDVRPGFTAIRQILPDGRFQTFPISDAASPAEVGAHFVNVESGTNIPDLDFGSQQLDNFPAGVSGRKWEDFNANGQRDFDEPGLGGVTIYVDTNLNGVFDPDEPSAVTMEDIPETDFDEGGLYSIGDLQAGFHVVREVVPDGFVQTFPISIAASPLESGAHYVFLAPGEFLEGLDFGNVRFGFPLPGDFNSDGTVDHYDLSLWEEGYGGNADIAAATDAEPLMRGADFLSWQQNLGRTTIAPPVDEASASENGPEPLPTGLDRAVYRPSSAREDFTAVEAAFAGESLSASSSAAAAVATSPESSQPARGAVAPRAAYADLAAAIDAALEDEFSF